jgi:hypothetical protein
VKPVKMCCHMRGAQSVLSLVSRVTWSSNFKTISMTAFLKFTLIRRLFAKSGVSNLPFRRGLRETSSSHLLRHILCARSQSTYYSCQTEKARHSRLWLLVYRIISDLNQNNFFKPEKKPFFFGFICSGTIGFPPP